MMLYKLSKSNVKKSFKDYAIYFVTLIIGVCIFYIFNSLDSQTAMLEMSSRQSEMIELLEQILSYVSVFVSFVLAFLIIYASRFLIKKRNKEFGIYLTLGMSKKKVSLLLLIETFLIGLISLAVGLGLGIILSQITSIFIANLFDANMNEFTFNYSNAALIKTIIYFAIIYLVVMIFNTITVNKQKLIDLINSNKKQEKVKIKNPFVCIILFIISCICLVYAYYLVTIGFDDLLKHDFSILAIPIGLGVFGTFLFYFSVSGMFLKIISKSKNIYYKGLNSFTIKQLSSKINTMVGSVTLICIMLFFTLCLLSSAFTIKNYFNNSIRKYAPLDFIMVQYNDEKSKLNDNEIINLFTSDNLLNNNVKDLTLIHEYESNEFLYKDSLGNYYETLHKQYPYVTYNENVSIMGISDYKKLVKLYGLKDINLNKDEYAIISNYERNIYDTVLENNNIINIFNLNLKPAYKKTIEGFDLMGANPSNIGFFVVSDEVIDETSNTDIIVLGNYKNGVNADDRKDINTKIKLFEKNSPVLVDTKDDIKEASVGLSAIVTFIGLYIGIIFLISSSAILSLKELSDYLDDREKYNVLRKIGVDEKDINSSLFKQTLLFFLVPLTLAVIHTIFGLKFCEKILSTIGVNSILDGSYITFIFLIIIYGIYFILTYLCGKIIIRNNR